MKNANSKLLIFFEEFYDRPLSLHSLDHESCLERVTLPLKESLLHGRMVKFHSSCYGLVLIQIDFSLFLWNPLTKFFRKVLTYHTLSWKDHYEYAFKAELFFDSMTKNYKVMLVEEGRRGQSVLQYLYVAACWASSWERINSPIRIENLHAGPFFRGYKHWFSKGSRPRCYTNDDSIYSDHIYYFDPSSNQFIEVPKPIFKKGDENTIESLGLLDGCLCMTMTRWLDPDSIVFFVMKEYGEGDSWDIMFVIPESAVCRSYDNIAHTRLRKKEVKLSVKKLIVHSAMIKSGYVNSDLLWSILVMCISNYAKVILYEESLFSPTHYDWESCDYLSDPVDYFKEIMGYDSENFESEYVSKEIMYIKHISGYDSEDFKYEEYANTVLCQIDNLSRDELHSQRKKKDKRKEKKYHIKCTAQCFKQKEKKFRSKLNKRNYESKWGKRNIYLSLPNGTDIHEDI